MDKTIFVNCFIRPGGDPWMYFKYSAEVVERWQETSNQFEGDELMKNGLLVR
jgi:hypothetical protein